MFVKGRYVGEIYSKLDTIIHTWIFLETCLPFGSFFLWKGTNFSNNWKIQKISRWPKKILHLISKKAISERHFQMPRDSSGNVPPKVGVWIPRILILFFGWEFGTLKFLRRWEWEKSDSLWGMLETSGKIDSPKVSERILGKSPSPLKGFNVSKMVCSCLCSSHFFYFTIKIIWSKTATSTQW